MAVDESTRQEYLNLIGVDLWYSKVVLPGAKASGSFQFTVRPAANTSVRPVSTGRSNSAPALAVKIESVKPSKSPESGSGGISPVSSILSRLDVKPESPGALATKAEKVVPEPAGLPVVPAAQAAILPAESGQDSWSSVARGLGYVSLLVFRVGELVFVSEAHESHQCALRKLASSISEAVVRIKPSWDIGEPVQFDWPVFAHKELPFQSDADAARIFEKCIDYTVSASECTLIVMGKSTLSTLHELSRYLPDSSHPLFRAIAAKGRFIRAESLVDLLAEPLGKKALWQQLERVLSTG
ncbi:MAG: hypothetical protein CSA52_02030 [Gammaproteobacteria bacterium]|nr:MAG: hypothetical protein CSB48_07510 [Pseudomonadota bacterium]PIE38532.1 MAG: hypothetical protein CSA52_02030 [Gammaproteobacteria bacterium]